LGGFDLFKKNLILFSKTFILVQKTSTPPPTPFDGHTGNVQQLPGM
jgi:hypothetical protein